MATRPIKVNGLGLCATAARAEIELLERFFIVLRETPALYPAWKRLVFDIGSPGDFRPYDGVEVIDPAAIASA